MVAEHLLLAFNWASWSSIIAGLVAALAVYIVMGVFAIALGFKSIHPEDDEPMHGLGKTVGIWWPLSIIVSLACGGYVAGLLAGFRGLEHGFLVWAIVVIAMFCFGSRAVGSIARAAGSAFRSMGHGAAGMAGGMGKGAAHAASGAVAELRSQLEQHVDVDKLGEDMQGILRDTGIDTLQPEYLKNQIKEAKADIKVLARKLAFNPEDAMTLLNNFMDTEKTRLNNLTKNVDKNTAVQALMKTRNIPQEEAENMVDRALHAYDMAVDKAHDSLDDAREYVHETREHMKDMARKAREKADDMTSAASKAALAAGIALIIAAVICMLAALLGVHCSADWYAVGRTVLLP